LELREFHQDDAVADIDHLWLLRMHYSVAGGYTPLHPDVISDLVQPLWPFRRDTCGFEDRALAYEETTKSSQEGFSMRRAGGDPWDSGHPQRVESVESVEVRRLVCSCYRTSLRGWSFFSCCCVSSVVLCFGTTPGMAYLWLASWFLWIRTFDVACSPASLVEASRHAALFLYAQCCSTAEAFWK